MMNKPKTILLITIAIVVVACLVYLLLIKEEKPVQWNPENALHPIHETGLEITDNGDIQKLLEALDFSLEYFQKIDPQSLVVFGPQHITASQIVISLEDFKSNLQELGLTETFFQYVKENFTFYRSAADNVLFTGYYEARLKGATKKSDTYSCPLYQKPDDLVRIDLSQFPIYDKYPKLPKVLRGRLTENKRIVPYYSRQEIDYQQKLSGQGLELVWIENPVDVFFLHIQGSGIVQLDSGETMRVNYADSNGHPYRAIGRLLIDRGDLTRETVSMQTIREYLETHPDEVQEVFNYNPSYVFFRKVEKGPIGFLGVPVTAYRSIATDRHLFPKGALCYIETEVPVFDEKGDILEWKKHSGFVLNQDTGGAIRSPGRVDLFTGYGRESEQVAGHMKQNGMFYFLIKHPQGTLQ